MSQSTASQSARKVSPSDSATGVRTPAADFPLRVHSARGYWCKKVSGKVHYFGKVADDPDGKAALAEWLRVKDFLLAGRLPPPVDDQRLTLRQLCNQFLDAKRHLIATNELSPRSLLDYFDTANRMVEAMGEGQIVEDITPNMLAELRGRLAKIRQTPVTLGTEIGRARVILNYAYNQSLIERPVRFGDVFRKPSKRAIRKARAAREFTRGKMMFQPEEIRTVLGLADVHLRAMILLAINCGLGNADCGTLIFPALQLDRQPAWLNFPRQKTAVWRRCPLWPQTVEALKVSIAARREPRDEKYKQLVFVTRKLGSWFKTASSTNPISQAFRKVLIQADIHRKGVGFYALRHTFETVGGHAKDQVAVDFLMGHVDETMANEYREDIFDERLLAVTDHVRTWLYDEPQPIQQQPHLRVLAG